MSIDQSDGSRVYTPDSHLFPSLTPQDRHPSAPLLHSMLTSGVSPAIPPTHNNLLSPIDNKDIMMGTDLDSIGQRVRSSSMPSRAPRLPPQISISSPDDIFCKTTVTHLFHLNYSISSHHVLFYTPTIIKSK